VSPKPQKQPQRPQQKPQPKPPPVHKIPQKPLPPQREIVKASGQTHFACPSCGRPFSMPQKAAGRKAKCPCGARILVPPPGGVPQALYMPPEDVRRTHQEIVRKSGDKNATEIALEGSSSKYIVWGAIASAAIGGYFWFNRDTTTAHVPNTASTSDDGSGASESREMTATEIALARGNCVATVEALDENGGVAGRSAGFVVSGSHVATAFDVLFGASSLRIRLANGDMAGVLSIAGCDAGLGAAVLTINRGELPEAPMGDSDSVSPGARLTFLPPGAVGGVPPVESRAEKAEKGWIRAAGTVGSGGIGGPAFDLNGRIVGMALMRPDGAAVVPINRIKEWVANPRILQLSEVASQALQRSSADLLNDAKTLMAAGRASVAVSLLERAAGTGKAPAEILTALGQALLADSRPRAARRRFEAALRSSGGWQASSGLGRARLDSDDAEGALPPLRAALAGGGAADPVTLARLALALGRLGDRERAIAAADKAVSLAKSDLTALETAAAAYGAAGAADSGAKALDALKAAGATDAAVSMARGEMLLALRKGEDAAAAFEEAAKAGPSADAKYGLGRALEAQGKAAEAAAAWKDATRLKYSHEPSLARLARHYARNGNTAEAVSAWKSIQALDPGDAQPNVELGRLLMESDPAKAVEFYELAAAARPDSAEIVAAFARGLVVLGERTEAVERLEAFLKTSPGSPEARIELAALKATETPEEALKLLEGVKARGETMGRAAHARGTALLALDRAGEARMAFEEAVSWDPANTLYRFDRAMAAESEDVNAAMAYWEAFLDWSRKNASDQNLRAKAETRLRERYGR
jgi:tetratricopeptide (TPR) repeat protein/DNA-directed RNA polymerase subunit RPC12/RpoP